MNAMQNPMNRYIQFVCRSLIFQRLRPHCLCSTKHFSNDKQRLSDDSNEKLGNMASKYRVFKDEDAEIVIDLYEERTKKLEELMKEDEDPFEGINLQRGKQGVFDIEDLIAVLKRENAENIFVASVPKEIGYVDYICVVSGKSQRHLQAIAHFVRRVYKKKRHGDVDAVPRLEGESSKDWMALDLGNIALHIFSKEAREFYDLDSLWAIGPKFDKECNKQQVTSNTWSDYLRDLQPAS